LADHLPFTTSLSLFLGLGENPLLFLVNERVVRTNVFLLKNLEELWLDIKV
jgi:hypothetical protein